MRDSAFARVALDRDASTIFDLARGHGFDTAVDQVAERFRKLKTPSANVFVVGWTRVGKSSVINGILGRALLPTDSVPCTGALVEVVGSDEAALEVELIDGRHITGEIGSIADYASEERNPGNVRQIARVTARLPDAVLATGLHVFDTPGSESLHSLHERVLLVRARGASARG